MAAEGTGQEYEQWIAEERAFLANNRTEYEKLLSSLPEQSLHKLKKITSKLMMVNADSDPSKALWCVAQCREIMSEWDDELALITRFEKAQRHVQTYDQEQAAKGE